MGSDESNLRRVSPRDFLALSAGLITAISLEGISGAGISHAAEVQFLEGRCEGKKNMKERVLVTYASKYGSTGGVADAIGRELCSKDMSADVFLIKNASNVRSYQGVVMGSAIYRGKWMSEAIEFVEKNKDALRQMPVAYFLVCMTMCEPSEKSRAVALSYMDHILKAAPEIRPVGIGTFAGALDYKNLSWPNKMIMKPKGAPQGDFRNWGAIRSWTREPLYAKFIQ